MSRRKGTDLMCCLAFDVAADRWRTFNRVRGLVREAKRKVVEGREEGGEVC